MQGDPANSPPAGLPDAEMSQHAEGAADDREHEFSRQALPLRIIEALVSYVRYAFRAILKSPSFALVAILTLTFGIGINTALFTVIEIQSLRSLPVEDPWSFYQIKGRNHEGLFVGFTTREYEELRDRCQAFDHLFAASKVLARTKSSPLVGHLVSGNYFTALRVPMSVGRPIWPEDDQPSSPPVIVLSDSVWTDQFAADPAIVGGVIELNERPFTVVGIAPASFTGLDSPKAGFWAPISARPLLDPRSAAPDSAADQWLQITGRIKPDVTREQAQTAVGILLPGISEGRAREERLESAILSSRRDRGDWSKIVPLFVAFGLIFLITCTNLANVQLARSLSRNREIAVRLALGATRTRVVFQLFTESILLAILGGVCSLFFSQMTLTLVMKRATAWGVPATSLFDVSLDAPIFGFSLLLSALAGIVFGLIPALQVSRPDLIASLKGEGSVLGPTVRQSFLRDALVVAQFTMSLALLVGAGLLIRKMADLSVVTTGMDTSYTFSLRRTASVNSDLSARFAERLEGMPGVTHVARTTIEPFGGLWGDVPVSLGTNSGAVLHTYYNSVSPDYFTTLGIPILQGRPFTAQEATADLSVAIISQYTAQQFWPGENPIGKQFSLTIMRDRVATPRIVDVVGVAGDVIMGVRFPRRDYNLVYLPIRPLSQEDRFLVVRVDRDPRQMRPALRDALSTIDTTGQFDLRTLDDVIDRDILQYRLISWVASLLGVIGLLLASIGLFGVIDYLVGQRTYEIGIRMALGAQPRDILWLMLGGGFRLLAISVVCGVILSVAFSRILSSLVFGIKLRDPLVFLTATAVLVAVGLIACYLPARRAMQVDPNVALRHE